ncbi:uncharacterized protein LOC108818960 [Raphanus sativus]|uniref:Uncharacterized protein LOC108818960 n=1 Tax=Raphanus sativus TaxID=3726 RepID=A0A6J0KIU6_RAPSA|nr:uncharacterized protein LOC108818960 [Raphanus sativus]
METDLESELISLISQLVNAADDDSADSGTDSDSELEEYRNVKFIRIITPLIQIISLVRSVDFDALPKKPESKLISLVAQAVSLFNSSSLPEPLSSLISLISRKISMPDSDLFFPIALRQTLGLEPAPRLVSLAREIVSLVIYLNSKKLIQLCPQRQVSIDKGGKIKVFREGDVKWRIRAKWNCFIGRWKKFKLIGGDNNNFTHFICGSCNGKYHQEYDKAPIQIKHPLHPKHSLQLVSLRFGSETRVCYCCDGYLHEVFYYCSACDYAINVSCVEKPLILARDFPKWHEHTLALFPTQASFPCSICALTHSACPFYVCPPCDFVIHQKCISLPRVIRISRHPHHRIFFTPSFTQEGHLSCGVCRRKMENDYGGYSCVKDGCSYAAHSRCATQSNVWDGIDLDGVPEEIEEEVEPFVRISDGVIRHFSHDRHLLRLDENKEKVYDETKLCQACVTPIYFGNFYSCVQCEFVLHETCANLSRKIYHPIHPHQLVLVPVGGYDHITCSACDRLIPAACFSYECGKEECNFHLHVQCATTSEPLVHGSHAHPLFLTTKPEVWGSCSVCSLKIKETFNCIECDDFSMCFQCATIPPKVRYKHDKHILTLSYGEDTSTTMTYWCEVCERKIDLNKWFYTCDQYCCVTLHIGCLIGRDLFMKPGSSLLFYGKQVDVLSNNHLMSRPICANCLNRSPHKIAFQCSGLIACSLKCFNYVRFLRMVSL